MKTYIIGKLATLVIYTLGFCSIQTRTSEGFPFTVVPDSAAGSFPIHYYSLLLLLYLILIFREYAFILPPTKQIKFSPDMY